MKCLLIYRVDISDLSHSGVLLKMKAQRDALEDLGHEVDLVNHDDKAIYKNAEVILSNSINSYVKRSINSFTTFFNTLRSKLDTSHYDLVYIRYPFSTPSFLKFCKSIKDKNRGAKLVIEMPTYPYNKEFYGLKKLHPLIDNHYRLRLKRYVDRIVHFGPEKSLFGIDCINTINGIDTNTFKLNNAQRIKGEIRLLAIAKWSYWHGLDRLLEGLKEYDHRTDRAYRITLTIVGAGTELINLKQLVKQLGIEKLVCFTGVLRGKALDEVFDLVDLGIGTIGIHRKGLSYNSSLKHREYCVRGLAFILSTEDKAFPKDLGFVSYVPAADAAIEMNEIIALYEKQLDGREIQKYAMDNFEWKIIMGEVVDQINA